MRNNKYLAIYEQISADKQIVAEKLIEDILFMDKTLKTLRKTINAEGSVEDFKQGKQEFKRESPALKSYNNTVKQRNATFTQLLNMIPKSSIPQGDALDGFLKEFEDV